MMIRYTLSILILTGVIFAGCAGKSEKAVKNNDAPVPVTVNQSSSGTDKDFVSVSGKLIAKNSANVSTRMMGYIVRLTTDVGQSVRAGQLLFSINSTDLEAKRGQVKAQIAMAQANFNNAKKDYERFQNLFKTESASQKELDDMTTRYESAKAGLEASKQMEKEVNSQFSYANVTAPISGIVTAKYANQGDMANPGMPILTIESPSLLQAQVLVSEQDITRIKPGNKVQVVVKAANKTIPGTIAEISKSSANTGGQYIVKVGIQNSADLLPGMFVNVLLPFADDQKVNNSGSESVMIPETALVKNGQLTGVYVVSEQKTAVLRWLKTGRKLGSEIEILSGLKADEPYIISSDGRLYNGVPVVLK